MSNYKDFHADKINENKNKIVNNFLNRDFDEVWPQMQENEKLAKAKLP